MGIQSGTSSRLGVTGYTVTWRQMVPGYSFTWKLEEAERAALLHNWTLLQLWPHELIANVGIICFFELHAYFDNITIPFKNDQKRSYMHTAQQFTQGLSESDPPNNHAR